MRWTAELGALLTFVASVLGAHATRAYTYLPPEPHDLDPVEEELDRTPPGAISAITATVTRGVPPEPLSSCGFRGSVKLLFEAPTDNVTPPERLGYQIAVIAGSAPPGLIPAGQSGRSPTHFS